MNNQWNQMPPNMPPQQRPPMLPNMPPQQRPPMPPNMPPRQGKMPRPELSPEDKKQADKLCIISMILMFAPMVVIFLKNIVLGLLFDAGKEEFYYNIASSYVLGSILTFLMAGCGIAALVLMILVRVKYPQSVFGKVLMWLYIALAILVVVFIAVTIIACGLAFISCVRNCPG